MQKQKTSVIVSKSQVDSSACTHFSVSPSPSSLSRFECLRSRQTMHRQSVGSPSSKLHIHGGNKEDMIALTPQEPKLLEEFQDEDDHNNKASKSHRLSISPSPQPEKFIHLIPILTLLCFFILFLFSHSPSQSDLAQFNGFKRSSMHFDSAAEMNDIRQHAEVKRGDILAIRSMRNLQEIEKHSPKSRPHRKIADC